VNIYALLNEYDNGNVSRIILQERELTSSTGWVPNTISPRRRIGTTANIN
jgi:hypothetical protein